MTRRHLLKWCLYSGLGLLVPGPVRGLAAAAATPERTLSLYHVRTRETLEVVYHTSTGYVDAALAAVSHLMRDRRTGEIKMIDPLLLDYLYAIQSNLKTAVPFHITSGYRSHETNSWLRRNGKGAARDSYHMKGQAVDLRMPGIETAALQKAALEIRAGGLGYYPNRHFVHLDVGPIRFWSA